MKIAIIFLIVIGALLIGVYVVAFYVAKKIWKKENPGEKWTMKLWK